MSARPLRRFPASGLGIHAHNDTANAVANSLAAVRGGVRQIQGTLNGLGERCGNANLVSLIPTLALKPDFAEAFEIGVSTEALAGLSRLSHSFDELLNRAPDRHAPYVGASAFATKAGIHASALAKDPRTYEHVPPESVGNARAILVSDQAGRSNLVAQLKRLGVGVDADDPRLARVLDEVKAREAQGYAYEGADASFELLARKHLGGVPKYFDVEMFNVSVEHKRLSDGLYAASLAVVKIRIGGEALHFGGGRRRAGQRARHRFAQGPRRLSEAYPGCGIARFPRARVPGRHRRRDAGAGGVWLSRGRALVDGRRQRQHHRGVVSGSG